MFCYSCGNQISDAANFCRFCGADVRVNANTTTSIHFAQRATQSVAQPNPQQTLQPTPSCNQTTTQTAPPTQNVFPATQSKPASTSKNGIIRIIFLVGYALLIVLAFTPWAKAGIVEYTPFLLLLNLCDGASASGNNALIAILILVGISLLVYLASVVIGIVSSIRKTSVGNWPNIGAFAGCILFLLATALSSFALKSGAPGYEFRLSITPLFGLFIAAVVSALLIVLGSGKVNIQKLLNKSGF